MPLLLAFVSDLMFTTRIAKVAEHLGYDVAWIETETPNAGPKGSKGVGEPPCVPTAGAVANAVARVIGARVRALPMTPERVWAAKEQA